MNEDEQKQAYEEHYSERAAIREFDGGQSREEAEAAAREETKENMFRCMIRQLIRWNNNGRRDDVVAWLDRSLLKNKRDAIERKRYADALTKQLKLGNKGNVGEWKT